MKATSVIFFFQAEDGIRDIGVTGVQTCALPILTAAYASLDVFVHTGPHETFCQAAQEALASGIPVVAPAAGGLLDLVRPEENGLWFAPGSAEELAACVRTLQQQPALRRWMGE